MQARPAGRGAGGGHANKVCKGGRACEEGVLRGEGMRRGRAKGKGMRRGRAKGGGHAKRAC